MANNLLLILGHPSKSSFCKALLDAYKAGAAGSGAVCRTIYVGDLSFDPNLADGYRTASTRILEADLVSAQESISWADHIVISYPNWWGFMPAVMKGFLDRVLLPGFAFRNHSGKLFPEKLLKGKSMRLLVTMDTPKWWFYLIYRASQYQIIEHIVFGYVGFDPIRFSTFGFIRKSTDELRAAWLRKAERLGKQLR